MYSTKSCRGNLKKENGGDTICTGYKRKMYQLQDKIGRSIFIKFQYQR